MRVYVFHSVQLTGSLLIHFVLVFIGIPNSVFIVIPIAGYVDK
jgi:hypothetical protein